LLKNADFEAAGSRDGHCAPGWGCGAHAGGSAYRFVLDTAVAAHGRQSLRIERASNEPWGVAIQALDAQPLRGGHLRFSIAVRVAEATGEGGGLFLVVEGASGTLYHDRRLVRGTHDWRRLSADFDVPADAQVVKVGGTLEGPGTLWIDDARLEKRAAR
jgi:hypothetical protein